MSDPRDNLSVAFVRLCARKAGLWEQRAIEALHRRTRRPVEMTPAEVARTVAGVLPAPLGGWLLLRLAERGWLSPAARLPFDILDSPACPPEFRGPPRALVRLAVFGLPGQGQLSDAKRREAVYQQLAAEIQREGSDPSTLSFVSARALRHPEVQRDPGLAALICNCIAQRRAEIEARQAANRPEAAGGPARLRMHEYVPPRTESNGSQAVLLNFERLRHEFEDRLTRFDTTTARDTLQRLDELQKRFPDLISTALVERCRVDLARVEQRREQFEREIEELSASAVTAAREGRHDEASRALRRLSAIHTGRPNLLPTSRFQRIREEIALAGQEHENRQIGRLLVRRERAVAKELRELNEIIRHFGAVARQYPPESQEYRDAEAEYRRAVRDVRCRDSEWLAQLTLELDGLLEDLHDPTGRAEAHVTRFIASVRAALIALRHRIKRVAAERHSAQPPPS